MTGKLIKFYNCKILKDHKLQNEHFWVRDGKIINPEPIFFNEKISPDIQVDCENLIIAPGFIDAQINGGYGVDFSYSTENIEAGVALVAKNLLKNGVTSFCPTIVTSPVEIYHKILPKIKKRQGDQHGATVLGIHVEGPFINPQKKGAHPQPCIKNFCKGFESVESVYGNFDNIKIVTLAPELPKSMEVIKELVKKDIVVSLGHSIANLVESEEAVKNGASFITHLFNAMLPFHHRDPGLVGLLASEEVPRCVYFGLISDGNHTHPAAIRIAYRTHPRGLVLVTDAISALGLNEGKHFLGQYTIEVKNSKAYIANTNTLCGSIANLNECVQLFHKYTDCPVEYALEAASLHPALALGIEKQKGTLNFDGDADFIILDENLLVVSTWIAGECVFSLDDRFSSYCK